MIVSDRLVAVRKKKGYTRKRLAEELGYPYRTITNYEMGVREPGHKYIIEVARKFNVTTDYLLGLSDIELPKKQKTSPFSDEAMRLADDYDKRLDHYGRKQVRSVADNEIARVEAANTKMEAGEIDVEAELAEYSRQLNLQKKAEAGSSASSGSEGKGA